MNKQNLKNYSERELSLVVFNDEGLYYMRKHQDFFRVLDELFEYTEEQLEILKQDLKEEE